jgi:hypothetical protein
MQLMALGARARAALLWALFKMVQATVAASFSFIIVAQACMRGAIRFVCGEPPELLVVRAARKQHELQRGTSAALAAANSLPSPAVVAQLRRAGGKAAAVGGIIQLTAVAVPADISTIEPIHVFNEPDQGELCRVGGCVGACAAAVMCARAWLPVPGPRAARRCARSSRAHAMLGGLSNSGHHAPPPPRTRASAGHDSEAWRLVGPFMRQYGRHAIANSQLFNPEFIHFFIPGVGSLPYIVADM